MGWWKINGPGGGIDWDAPCEGNLVNAIPGQSTVENHYNGDEPADIVDDAVEELRKSLRLSERRLREIGGEEVAAFLMSPNRDYMGGVRIGDKQRRIVLAMCIKVRECYEKAWGRPPYPEEVAAVVSFCTGGLEADEPG